MFTKTLDNKRYHTLNYYLQNKYGTKVFKIPLNTHFGCPNKKYGGCIFCKDESQVNFIDTTKDVLTQFNTAKEKLHIKWPHAKYIAYFQAGTNTYADIDVLRELFTTIIKEKNVVGLNIGTRPDAISNECLELLKELNKVTDLTIELGLQSIHDNTLKLINRGHDLKCFDDCLNVLYENNINVVVHIINGLPYETKEDMIDTVKYLNSPKIGGIKIHMLHILKMTPLEKMYEQEEFHILTKEEYIDIVTEQLCYLNENIVIHRITGDPIVEDLIAPTWLVKKFCVLNDIDKMMVKKDVYQGCKV